MSHEAERYRVLREFMRNRNGKVGIVILVFFVLMALLADFIAPYRLGETTFKEEPFMPPSSEHILGTDQWGNDLFTELVYGARTTLFVAFVAAGVSTIIGALVGLVAGYYGGLVDEALMRIVDVMLVIPAIPLQIVLASYLGPSMWNIILVIIIFGWITVARVIRSQVLSIKQSLYIEAAVAIGATSRRIIFKHILPNTVGLIIAYMALNVAGAVYTEAGLSFLGLGDPIAPSWGKMLHYAQIYGAFTRGLWWWIIAPGACIMSISLATALIGNALIELTNPKMRRR